MIQTLFSGSFKSQRELSGPRQLRQAYRQLRERGWPVQVQVKTHQRRHYVRFKSEAGMVIVRY